MGQFSNKIRQFREQYRKRYRATARLAVSDTIRMAQRTTGEGGRMRVQTGFLRASVQGAINHMPSGPTSNEDNKQYAGGTQVAGEPIAVTLAKWDPLKGQVLFIGWTANYARPREYKDGFLRGSVEMWDSTVDRAAARVKHSDL